MGLSATLIEAEIYLIKYPDEGLEESLLLKRFCCHGTYLNQVWLADTVLTHRILEEKNNLTNLEIIWSNQLILLLRSLPRSPGLV